MKKFARFLGFLGFFATLATVQIGTAWAVVCDPGQYLPADSDQCANCPGTKSIDGITQGVYCPHSENYKEKNSEDQGLEPCRNACGTNNDWLTTRESAAEADACTGTCTGSCITPTNCLEANGCFPIIEPADGTLSCGDTQCSVSEECETINCEYCHVPSSDGETCVPKTNKAPEYRCSLDGDAVDFGNDAIYGQLYTVTGSASLCTAPSGNQEFAGWILTNDNYSGPYMPGTDSGTIASWPCVNDPVIFIPSWTGTCLEVIFDENGGTSPSGGHNKLYKIADETGDKWYEAGCKKQIDNPQVDGKPTKNNATFTGYYGPSPNEIYVFEPHSTGNYSTLVSNNNWVATSNRRTLYAHFTCDTGYYLVNGECVPNSYDITYICNNGTNQYTETDSVNFNDTYKVNGTVNNPILPVGNDTGVQCTPPTGNVFTGWQFNLNSQGYDNHDPIERWTWDNNGTFTATWGKGEFEITLDPTTGAWNTGVPAEHRKLYTIYSDGVYISSTREPGDKMTITENPLGEIPEKTATVTFKYCDGDSCDNPTHPDTEQDSEIAFNGFYRGVDSGLPYISFNQDTQKWHITYQGDWDGKYYTSNKTWYAQWGNGSVTLPTIPSNFWPGHTFLGWFTEETGGTQVTSPYAVTDSITLYAHWEEQKIDVKYTCVSPVDGESDTHTFNDDATYGDAYPVKSVGTGNHYVPCAFTGYELDDDYVWNLQDYSGNSNNPNGEYGPGADAGNTLLSTDWQYLPTPPLTEIEFVLNKSYWNVKTYTVEYRCGTIDNTPVSGSAVSDRVTYSNPYTVAHDDIPGSVMNNCDETLGETVSGYTIQDWTLTCNNQTQGIFNTGDPIANPNSWTYDYDDCYFTANWAQTDFEIILDRNGGTGGNPWNYLYTRNSGPTKGVYLDSGRQNMMQIYGDTDPNPLTPPQKTINIALYPNGNGATFVFGGTEYPNNDHSYASISPDLVFKGYYQNTTSSPVQYIEPHDEKGYITANGIVAGISYDENTPENQRTWVADWETYSLTLPIPYWEHHDFKWWACSNGQNYSLSDLATPIQLSENITCTAEWTESCYEVTFNDDTEHGGRTTGNGNHLWIKPAAGGTYSDRLYTDSSCSTLWYNDSTPVLPNLPTKDHATFTGYYKELQNSNNQYFSNRGALTNPDGQNWVLAVAGPTEIYAQYECVAPYHLMDDGSCGSCQNGYFFNPESQNPDQCDTCDQYLNAPSGTWHTRSPYNWSVKQCYRVCDGAGDTQQTCNVVDTVSGHNEMEQFLTGNLINGNTGKQISFYGNEFATSGAFNTCNATTGVTNCPQGFLSNGAASANKLMAAAVDFYEKRDLNGTYEPNGKRYIVGGRSLISGQYKLNNGFVWSQVVGDAQLEGNTEGNPGIISIIYPATLAPAAANPEHYTFSNYVYPEDGSGIIPIDSTLALTTSNAAGIISYAINLDPANNNMSPIITQNRNLYAQYTADPTYTLTYSCGDGGGTPSISPNPVTGIYAGDRIVPAQPEGCTNYGNLQFRWWEVSDSTDTHLAGDAGEFEWAYTENKTFTAIWGPANTYNITYLKMPTTNNSITPAGNTLEMPSNQSTSMPDSYTCNASPDTSISGVPRLKNEDNEYIGEVVEWCTDANLESCDLPLSLSNAAPCADKNVYAKWGCTDQRYHLNENKDDCVVCPNGDYWDPNANGGNGACVPCSNLPGGDWTSIAGYNWGVDQCYRFCPSGKICTVFNEATYGGFNIANVVQDNTIQIEFYGNHYTHSEIPDVCADDSDVEYCPKLLSGSAAEAFKPMSSPVTFKKKDNTTTAGTRHIVGIRNATYVSSPYYLTDSSGKIWSHIMGPGQYTGTGNEPNYTFIIYPTDAAPEPSANASADPLFKGYYDTPSGGTRYVEYLLGLDSTNATDIMSGMTPANQIMNRTLYPQYCDNGTTWNGSTCTSQTWTVTYECGPHGETVSGMSMTNTATFGEPYKVAFQTSNSGQMIAACTANTGYVLKLGGPNNNNPMWKLNNQAQNEHYTGEVLGNGWQYTISNPTFTAQYECDTEHGYTLQNGQCVLGSGLCQAHLPTNPDPHATMTTGWNAVDGCVYTITCDPCNETTNHSCYTYTGMDANGQFIITGAVGDAGAHVLDNVFCSPSTYTVYYRCNDNASPTADTTSAVYGEDYTIRTNGYSAGDILNCTSGTGQFNGWTFNGGSNPDQLYEGGAPLLWTYYNLSPYPLFTAHYGQCDEGQVLINGFCETCTCPQSNWTPTGAVQSCDARPLTDDSCQAAVTCNEPYGNPQWSCDGAVCSASCSTCPDNQVSVGGVCYDTCTASCDAPSTDNGCPVSGYPTFVTCSYDVQSVGGYDTGDGRCRYIDGANAGQVIDLGACSMTGVTCNDTNYDWNGDSHACERTANYTCGNHGSSTYPMSNIVQYGQNYVVAYKDGTQIAGCTQIDTGYTFIDKWTLNTAPLNTGGFGTGNTIWWGSGGQTYFTNSQSPLFTAMYSCATGYYEPVPDTCCDIATTYWNSSTQQCETCPNGYHPNSNNTDCDPDGPTPDQYHRIALDRNGGTLSGENSAPVNLYTIEDDNVYSDPQRNNPFTELTSNPTKYSPVTFNYCNQNSTTDCSGSQTDSRDAYFEFKGFYDSYNERTIDESNHGRLNSYGFTQAIGYTGTADPIATWYAHWSDHSSIAQDQWFTLSDDVRPGYSFLRWTDRPNCAGNTVSYTQNNSFTGNPSNDVVYACWERTSCPDDEILIGTECKKKCWVNCTWTGAPTNPAACPSNIASIPDVVNCTYDLTSPVPQGPGYLQSPESTQCLDATTNQLITPYSPCDYTVNCTPPKVWNPSTSSCVYPSGTLWNVKFMCDTDGSLVQEYNISLNTPINVPDNSVTTCVKTGYSFTNWKDTAHPSASLVAGANNVPWTHEYNATYIPDWNDGNVYHVNLHAYSCDDPTNPDLTGTFNSYTGVQELWEKYNVAWYKNAGLDDQITTLSSLQLPTLSGWMFGGYNKTDGVPRLSCDNGTCGTLGSTLINTNEDWCAVWSKCNANEYWNNGDCISCSTATGGQYPYAAMGATSINDCYNRPCYRDCQPNFLACNIPHAETYTYVNESFIGSMYYPNTNSSACQLDIWLPATSGTVPNCQCRVATCETGYHANSDNTECLPDTHIITLNSHIDGFNGHVSEPPVLYTKYGYGAYLDSGYNRLMGTNGANPLDSVPEKSANVVLYGNGGTFTWNGYPAQQQATATANFTFQGFYVSEYANGTPYINNNGAITVSGDDVAKHNQSDSTVWHAQWQNGSITLPTPQRQCYNFNGWWTAQYEGTWAGDGGMTYTPSIATTNLYAHWMAGTYNITYHNGSAIYSGCYQTSYTYGNSVTINCSINPPSGSHQVFQGWCTNPDLTTQGCAQNPTISATDCGNKDYYAWWGCEDGYTWNGTACVAETINIVYNFTNNCGTTAPTQPSSCTHGDQLALPNPTVGTNYTFNSWTTNGTAYTGPFAGGQSILCSAEYLGVTQGTAYINGTCSSINEQCPATLPSNANLNTSYSLNPTPNNSNQTCTYHLQCNPCINCDISNYSCYTYNNNASNDGTFTYTGAMYDQNALANVRCDATQYDVYYRCDESSQGIAAATKATYGQAYVVEGNPHANANGGTLTCQSSELLFNGWKFSVDGGIYYPGTPNYMINSWNYCNLTPVFTASYGQCPAGQIYVNNSQVQGECKDECYVPCEIPDNGACPNGYPNNPSTVHAYCTYGGQTPSQQGPGYYMYPYPYSTECLNRYTANEMTPQACTDVISTVCVNSDGTQATNYTWNPTNKTCDPNTYTITLNPNGGVAGTLDRLYVKYNTGWSIDGVNFTNAQLQLNDEQLPHWGDLSKVFNGFRHGGVPTINANGWVAVSLTYVTSDQTWDAQWTGNTNPFNVKFECTNGTVISNQNVGYGGELRVPAMTSCSGEAFSQWKNTLHYSSDPIMLDTETIVPWEHYFDEVFVPDTKAVYHVDLNENGGTFPADDYQELWYAVDLGWYKDSNLATQITRIPGNYLPTKQGSNFNGWKEALTQDDRGYSDGINWMLPTSISGSETWNAQWGPCGPNQFWDSNSGTCKSCSVETNGEFPNALPNATSINQCYDNCNEECKWNASTEAACNLPNATHPYDHYTVIYPGKHFYGRDYCSLDIWSSNSQGTIPNCECKIRDCEPGYVLSGDVCVEREKHIITLDSHIIHGSNSDPDVLYTWEDRGVYLYSNYTGEMTTTQNPLSENPLNYAIVTFNLNGQGASLIWNGQTYMGSMDANVLFDYQGFWKSVNGSPRYIDVDGYINGSGIAAGTGYTDDATWHARWQSRTLGTISSSGNDLPVPTRPGFVFDGWYDLPVGGNQVYSSSLVNNDMTVYARWSDVIYTVNLVSDRNNCQPSNNTPTKLYEKYNVGWNRSTTGRFDPNLTLTDDELPTPNAGYEFKGYYDALNGGERVIRSDGRVEQEPNYTDNTHTWYARCGRPTGPFTITFRCGAGENPLPNYTQSVQNGGAVRVPPKSACSNAGYSFTSWMGNHNTTFTARDTEYTATWSDVYANEDFTPNWNNGNVYYVTLAQTDATEPGIEILYEKYDNGWGYTANGPFNVTRLSGSQLPRRSGYVFAGYKYNDVQMGYVSNGQWRLPDPTVLTDNNQVWEPDWSQCEQGEYWDGNKCYPCPDGFTDNPHAIGAEQCYGNCEYDCQDSGCPSPLPVGMQSCAPNHSDYPQWGIKYNRPGATCLPQGQQSLPICPNDIICNNGYDLVGTECRDNRYTIALNSNLYNDNGTLANPSTLYTWFNHGVYRDYNRTYMMTPNDYPLESGTPSTYATVTLNGNGAMFNWHDMYGGQLSDNVDFVFDGFYDTTGAEIDPVIGINRYITGAGQSIGTTAQNNQTWQARWLNGSVDLPGEDIMSRDGYTFAGWWNACDGGALVSMGNQTIAVSGDRTLCAHWSGKSYTVTYNCNSEDGQGGSATDNQLAYQNTSYTVRENFIPCSKPATETTRAHEFENWKFNLNSNTYWPGDSILWIFTDDNPTFNAHYKECGDGHYFGSNGCQACPGGYDHSNINATQQQHCYRNCPIECNHVCPDEEGILDCVYTIVSYPVGTQYYGGDCQVNPGTTVESCDYRVICDTGYLPDANWKHCIRQNQHEITLDANCGVGEVTLGQEKLYTTENTGVYLNPARTSTYLMTTGQNPLSVDNLPKCVVTATFNHCDNDDPNCDGATLTNKTVGLVFNGYYGAPSNGSRYTDARLQDELESYITEIGMIDGKGYTTDATWYAHWLDGIVGSQKWPTPPTRLGRCNVTAYTFGGWWTDPNGGEQVYQDTQIHSNVTWYAHWCESCTGSIEHGSCSAPNCTATIACDTGYGWDETQCACVATTDLTLTYRPNGGTPDQNHEYLMTFGDTFTPLPGTTYTMENNRIAYWKRVTNNCSNLPQEFDFDESYTYNCNGNTILDAQWKECHCSYTMDSGVASCETFVDNNLCKTRFECKPGYVPMPLSECGGQYLTECGVNCTICPAGTYQNGNVCTPCGENEISAAGATQCTPCSEIYGDGYHANADHTQCEPNTITIDWDENGGNEIDDGSCVYGQTFTLANAPTHNNNAMQFLGWKLATGNDLHSAGTDVMCTHNNVGVYSGTSTAIKAQWNQCQCINPLNPHVEWCQAWFADGECKYISGCERGYEPDPLTVYTPAAVCNPITSNITYNCGDGTGTPVTVTDTATYGSEYIVKNEGGANCQKTGFNFAGWLLSANNQTYQPGYTFTPWSFENRNVTFTAQYTNIQCASDEILIGNDCVKCNCTIGTGATNTSCGILSTAFNTCEWTHPVECLTGFEKPSWSCTGTGNTNCIAQCDQIQSDAIYVCGTGATGTPPATQTMNYGDTHTVKPNEYCAKFGHTFNGWNFSGNNGYYNAGAMVQWNYTEKKTFAGQWCENCGDVANGSCSLDATNAGQCSYTTSCYDGYVLVSGAGTAHPVCNPSNYNVTYRPNGGVNPQTGNNQPVWQPVTYWDDFTTLVGTTFTWTNHILTRWDLDGDDASTFYKHQDPDTNQYYAELKEYYEHYNTLGDTILDAHWESCTCDADNCTTYATDENKCACNATCPTGYTYGGCNCNGTVCTPICNKKQSDAIYECGEGATGQAPAPQTMNYGDMHTVKDKENCSKTNYTFMKWAFTGDGDYHNPGDTIAWYYTEDNTFTGQWCENCGDVVNGSCELGNDFAGSCQYTCSCEPGYKLVGECNAHPVCEPDNTLVIHYESDNGLNQTYNQSVTYGQPFVTEGGTRFTKVNNIMTQWKVENNATTTTFPTGIAGLSGDYVYDDTTDTTLEAQWEQCTCDADGCTTYATNSNECACNASEESCPDGYIYGGCECNGTNCAPICTLSQSNAIYNCGTGTGIPPVSELVSYGTPYTIKANATVYGCSRENSTFAGWEFDGDQQIHAAGDTVTWNYTTDKNFRAVYCNNCLPEDHCTLDIPNPGECVVTCHTGYEWDSNLKKCVAKTYPGDEGITYKPNGGTPNRNYTQTVTYDASFTTLDWSAEHYRKPRNILTRWTVESGGAGTFDSGYANLGTEYTYKTDGATVLAADWTECAADKISLNNQCQQCNCTAGTGTTSCGTLSTDDDTCAWGPVSCLTGYVNPTLDCSDDTTNCTAYCTKCGNKQVEVNGACTDCECEINGDGVNYGCGFASNNGNICNWNPTTCKLGYGNPQLTCTETDYKYDCTASCTICDAGFYGDDGVECKPCPDGKTSLPGATSIRECFIDPNSCADDEHIEHGECVNNRRACSIPNATSAARIWNPAIGTYGPCTVIECDAANGYHESGNACVRDTCTVAHGSAESEYVGGQWECFVTKCDPGYEPSSDSKSCVECANRYVDGDLAVSSYVSECEIAACMYQGQKYALQNGECVPICESETDETGTKVWDERTKKCIRTCKPGYKMW